MPPKKNTGRQSCATRRNVNRPPRHTRYAAEAVANPCGGRGRRRHRCGRGWHLVSAGRSAKQQAQRTSVRHSAAPDHRGRRHAHRRQLRRRRARLSGTDRGARADRLRRRGSTSRCSRRPPHHPEGHRRRHRSHRGGVQPRRQRWPAAAPTAQCGCGTPRTANRSVICAGTPTGCSTWRSAPTATGWPAQARRHGAGVGHGQRPTLGGADRPHRGGAQVAFSPDGHRLVSAGADETCGCGTSTAAKCRPPSPATPTR